MHLPFQSTLPVWGATNQLKCDDPYTFISIHAPRVGSDWHCGCLLGCCSHFNPRSPCGERLIPIPGLRDIVIFQSTLPVWGATDVVWPELRSKVISIHAPRVGSDLAQTFNKQLDITFQSTLPVWGATAASRKSQLKRLFQSTLPVWGATTFRPHYHMILFDFNPRSPCGERQTHHRMSPGQHQISIHAPRVGSD